MRCSNGLTDMTTWLKAAERFEERRNTQDYFEMQSALSAIDKIATCLDEKFPQPVYLIGEPGSGKTFLLNLLYDRWYEKRHVILIETPFITPLSFLYQLIRHKGVVAEGEDIERLRVQATELYRGTDHVVMIDEAQLLSVEMREFVRMLSDSQAFWFLLAMHKKEGEAILQAPHFKSRPHRVVELSCLTPNECKNYLYRELLRIGYADIDELSPALIKKAHRISGGNFRNFKKLFYHFFHLLHYTNAHRKTKYLRPSSCTITMAAMSAELIHD